ncbi:MAG: PEP-CTERM sorting domain-containing protein [Planctomycetota bacterium]|jgi:hypothetical protein|nr:PEP-CTERM sorting domain-containing protein [Planctomycetota bacterium]MDP6518540.1 PEP-CTERM sorting domain-containing protein [Planctomycetota bacterium]MDP6839009.1 PEP-CTERM sorting domain-containing protein [Planctomycetota bacterium]MDP6954342.1 PEP-CTERM sorting domain-containing protein [Planctomycetota bacterium]
MKSKKVPCFLTLAAILGLTFSADASQGSREVSPSNPTRRGADRHPKGSATPEPFTMALVAGGGAVLYLAGRRRRRD